MIAYYSLHTNLALHYHVSLRGASWIVEIVVILFGTKEKSLMGYWTRPTSQYNVCIILLRDPRYRNCRRLGWQKGSSIHESCIQNQYMKKGVSKNYWNNRHLEFGIELEILHFRYYCILVSHLVVKISRNLIWPKHAGGILHAHSSFTNSSSLVFVRFPYPISVFLADNYILEICSFHSLMPYLKPNGLNCFFWLSVMCIRGALGCPFRFKGTSLLVPLPSHMKYPCRWVPLSTYPISMAQRILPVRWEFILNYRFKLYHWKSI